jgi:hypothetical protein
MNANHEGDGTACLVSDLAEESTVEDKLSLVPPTGANVGDTLSSARTQGATLIATCRSQPKDSGPWCWQSKKARRLIRERMNGDSQTVYVLSVYDALTEIASDESAETFTTSHPYLAAKAGCSVSQLKLVLGELAVAGLVRIETPKLKGPCAFTLLSTAMVAIWGNLVKLTGCHLSTSTLSLAAAGTAIMVPST